MDAIKIACEGAALLTIDEMEEFQGELKSLSQTNYKRLKTEILETGLAFPFNIWCQGDHFYIVGGHQRRRTLMKMREEGYDIPLVPVTWIHAKDRKEAKRRVLQDVSQYGHIERQGLYEFINDADLTFDLVEQEFALPDLDMQSFKFEYFQEIGPGDQFNDGGSKRDLPERRNELGGSTVPHAPLEEEATIEVNQLIPHPRNYRKYPDDQIQHIMEGFKEAGFHNTLVIAEDNTILNGHGMFEAAKRLGLHTLPFKKVEFNRDDTKALKILLNDNELDHLCEKDDRRLAELLKYIKENDSSGLLGTGYNDQMLSNLLFVTRPASEIADMDEAAHWVGLPEYQKMDEPFKIIVIFQEESLREEFVKLVKVENIRKLKNTWSFHWPDKDREDISSLRFDDTHLPEEIQSEDEEDAS